MKRYLIIAVVFILAGCASSQKAFKQNVTEQTQFHLKTVTVAVESKCPARDKHFTNEELQDIFTADVKKYLCEKRVCTETPSSDDVIVDAIIIYKRVNNGEGFGRCSGSYTGAQMSYTYTLTKNDKVFHSAADSALEAKRSFVGNLKRIGTNITGTGDKTEEKDDIDHMTKGIAARISEGR
ncbi:hypothetical protein Dip518_000276 [Parelusimicrobium proximum]|uniref:hypothetical protein n=1 Tax=Parelusimicrobium proximum TaxID=3228953 RepID=UPI003D1821CF